ncbi:hypothetical protein INH39_00530 [Massilia violaceinigra]|uniref:Uncharacterized protein n=1 Tax=Massilia violaceinigra TaxID=2045208 RepID=A0ABY4A9E0_9BURK|nr:hypothetical protein [Massilia violaceinigra]UOD30284.1 hypothetical protein INH39_00530 [Massilia violaceinigra]
MTIQSTLIRNYFAPQGLEPELLLLHGGQVHVPVPALGDVCGEFVDDGQGGGIACAASGQPLPAAREAAKVLARWKVYEPEFGDKTDAQWLPSIAHTAFNEASEAELLEELYANPLVLSQIPGRRITAAMVDVAVGADSNAVAHVPKRLMTAALYALAVRTHHKHESRVPPALRKGA